MLSHFFHLIVLGICETLKVTSFQLCRKAESCKTVVCEDPAPILFILLVYSQTPNASPPFLSHSTACLSHFLRNLHLHDLCLSPNCLEDTDSSYKARGIQKTLPLFWTPRTNLELFSFHSAWQIYEFYFFFALRAE